MKLLIGFLYALAAQILTFVQLQGNIKYNLMEKWPIATLALSIPIAWLYIKSTENMVQWFNGELWPSRFIGFSIGMIVFAIMSIIMFNEGVTYKTFVCILLSVSILLIQLFWK